MKYPVGRLVQVRHGAQGGGEYSPFEQQYAEGQKGFVLAFNPETKIYTVQVGMSNKLIPEKDLFDPDSDLHQKVEEHLRKKQEKKEFKDTEGRIGGSSKEKRAYQMITRGQLAEIEQDAILAQELIKKDKVYAKVDPRQEREKGVSAGAAYLKTKLRENFGAAPPNTPEARKVYTAFAEELVRRMDEVYTLDAFWKEVIDIRETFLKFAIGQLLTEEQKTQYDHEQLTQKAVHELNPISRSVIEAIAPKDITSYAWSSHHALTGRLIKELFGTRFDNFVYRRSNAAKEAEEQSEQYDRMTVEESIKAIEKRTAHYREQIESSKEKISMAKSLSDANEFDAFFSENGSWGFSGGTFFQLTGKSKHFYWADCTSRPLKEAYRERYLRAMEQQIVDYQARIKKIEEKYRVREEDWSWAFPKEKIKDEAAVGKPKAEIQINTYPPLNHITRVGGIRVKDEDVTVESIREKFAFREVEFGQSLKDSEAREHIRHALAAMTDLADILNWNLKQLNQMGGLSIAFASRGHGKASAHYESLRKVINITKSRGGGALAHEYMHYLDNILSGNLKGFFSPAPWTSTWAHPKPTSIPALDQAIISLFEFIYFRRSSYRVDESGEVVNVQMAARMEPVIVTRTCYADMLPEGRKYSPYVGNPAPDNIEDYWKQIQKAYSRYRFLENMKPGDWALCGWVVQKFGYEKYDLPFLTQRSQFYTNSVAMSSDYWRRPWELLARGFETYIADKLKKAGRENNYLVSGAYFDRPEGVYPYGDERKILFQLYENLMSAIKSAYSIGDFEPWTTERVDEFIAIHDEGKGKQESTDGIVVDEKTGQVVQAEGESAERREKALQKIRDLISILNRKSAGGLIGAEYLLTLQHID